MNSGKTESVDQDPPLPHAGGKTLHGQQERITGLYGENARLGAPVDHLERRLEDCRNLLKPTLRSAVEAEKRPGELVGKKQRMLQETIFLETALLAHMPASSCRGCEKRDTGRCPGPDLCGKTVLYVGGLHRMVAHYRAHIEKLGGRFLHHDGGREASRSLLPGMICRADAVLCPVDCVSHDACICVKRICKRLQKPFAMLRSSGLSSLSKGLRDLTQ